VNTRRRCSFRAARTVRAEQRIAGVESDVFHRIVYCVVHRGVDGIANARVDLADGFVQLADVHGVGRLYARCDVVNSRAAISFQRCVFAIDRAVGIAVVFDCAVGSGGCSGDRSG
jgi:hypothetical protein